jgi:hypothetical protein
VAVPRIVRRQSVQAGKRPLQAGQTIFPRTVSPVPAFRARLQPAHCGARAKHFGHQMSPLSSYWR